MSGWAHKATLSVVPLRVANGGSLQERDPWVGRLAELLDDDTLALTSTVSSTTRRSTPVRARQFAADPWTALCSRPRASAHAGRVGAECVT
ncbi:MAG: hypothetical protein R3F56_23225 [Planctomycetota bacterium]